MHEFLFPLYFCNHPIAYAGVKVIFYPIEKNLTKITLLDYKQRETQVLSRGDGYDEPLIRTKEGVNAFVEHFNHVVELKYNKNFDSKSLYSKSNLVIEGHPFWAFYDFLHLVFDICQLDSSKKETINQEQWHEKVDNFFKFMMENFTTELTVMGARVALTVYNLPFVPGKLKTFDEFHKRFGKYIVQAVA